MRGWRWPVLRVMVLADAPNCHTYSCTAPKGVTEQITGQGCLYLAFHGLGDTKFW